MDIFFNHFNQLLNSLGACQANPNIIGEKNHCYPQVNLINQTSSVYFMLVDHPLTPEEVAIVVNEYGTQALITSSIIGW